MSSDSRSTSHLGVAAALTWAGLVLVGYVVWRPDDVQPVVAALAARALDVAVPVSLLIAYLPLGARLLRWARSSASTTSDEAPPDLLLATAVGLFVAMATTALLAATGFVSAPAIVIMAGICLALGATECPRLLVSLRGLTGELADACRSLPGLTTLGVLALALLTVLSPAVSQDALHYHLEVPKRWILSGGFVDVPGNVYSRFPMNVELLYLDALVLRGEIAAKLWHWLFAVLAAAACYRLARNFAEPRAARWAPALFLSIPTVFRVATWAYVEMALVFFLLVGWEELRRTLQRGGRSFAIAGFLFGIACGIKYTAAPITVMAALFLVACASGRRVVSAASFAGGAALSGSFWYLKNWIEVGNPVYPFLYSWFGGDGWDAERAQIFRASLAEWGELSWSLPISLTFDATFASIDRFDGIVGPAFLACLPLLVWAGWRRREVRSTLFFAVVLGLLWVMATRQIRFLLPTLAVVAAVIPATWGLLSRRSAAVFGGVLSLAVALSLVSHLILFARESPVAFAVGQESGDDNRARRLPGGDAALLARIPDHVGEDERILFAASGNPVFLCERPYHADSVIENHTLRRLLRTTADDEPSRSEAVLAAFEDAGFTHLLFRFELVFGEPGVRTDLTVAEQQRLGEFLNRYAKQVDRSGGTFLYRIQREGSTP